MRAAPRVVLDTGVVLSALLISQGKLAPLRLAWRSAAIRPLVSKATVEELIHVLGYPKFDLGAEDRHELLADYLPHCVTVGMPGKPPRTPVSRNPLDIPFLRLALAGNADYLVTGDRDLLGVRGKFACPIITAGEFVDKLSL